MRKIKNKAEAKALQWLMRVKGIQEKDIIKTTKAPDFLTPIGAFEVKKLYSNTIIFYGGQIEQLSKYPSVIILVFNGKDEPIIAAPFSDIDLQNLTFNGLRVVIEQTKMARLTPELTSFLKEQGIKGESYDQTIRRLLEQAFKCSIPQSKSATIKL